MSWGHSVILQRRSGKNQRYLSDAVEVYVYLSFYLEVDGETVHTDKQKLLLFMPDPRVRLLSTTRSR